jgi:RHS repeat-associated protein
VHEHLDNLGLIHMNGRVQDPALGRFISADPYVPDWTSGQSYNRFSYVQNNPLTLIDPSGFQERCSPNVRCDSEGPSGTVNGQPMDAGAWLWVHGHAYCPPIRYTSFIGGDKIIEPSMMATEDPTLVADMLGGMIAPFHPDGCNPVTGRCLSPGELKDARFLTAVTIGAPIIGRLVAPVAKMAPSAANVANKVNHIFREGKNLDALIRASGGSAEAAYNAVQQAANQALRSGLLSPGPNGVLPGAGAGAILNVNGTSIQLIGGRVMNGVVQIGSFVGL